MATVDLHLLLVGIDQQVVECIRSAFEHGAGSVLISTAANIAALSRYVATSEPDVVVIDAHQFLQSVTHVSQSNLGFRFPLIVVGRAARPADAATAYRLGALDFVTCDKRGLADLRLSAHRVTKEFQRRHERIAETDSLTRFRSIVDMFRDFVAVLSLDGRTKYLNPAGRRVVGLEPEADITVSDLADFFTTWELEKLQNNYIPEAIDYGFWRGELTMLHRSGDEFGASILLLPNRINGEVDSISIIARANRDEQKYKQWSQEAAVARQRLKALTAREKQVFDLVVSGKPNKTIARELFLAEKTIEKHRARIKLKLDVSSIAALVRIGVLAELP